MYVYRWLFQNVLTNIWFIELVSSSWKTCSNIVMGFRSDSLRHYTREFGEFICELVRSRAGDSWAWNGLGETNLQGGFKSWGCDSCLYIEYIIISKNLVIKPLWESCWNRSLFNHCEQNGLAQEPLPGPPNPPTWLDERATDLELFRQHCMPLGDLWGEAGVN